MRPWYRFHRGWVRALLELAVGLRSRHAERVPPSDGLVVAANHFSFWDPPLVGVLIEREAYFLAKEELFRSWPLGPAIRSMNSIPIRRGVADLQGISRALDVLRAGGCLVMFPEGGRMKDGQLHRAKPGVGLIVAHARVPVVPAFVAGSNRIRRCLARQERVRVQFGPVLPVAQLLGAGEVELNRALYQKVADQVMDGIARARRELEGGETAAAPGPTERGATH
jgi:1-acyl-sn-glycerol-3-phosphate acyltransferase